MAHSQEERGWWNQWVAATHTQLQSEMPGLDKLSNAARLRRAKQRRTKQLKKWQEWVRYERASNSNGTTTRKKTSPSICDFEKRSLLADMVQRGDRDGG